MATDLGFCFFFGAANIFEPEIGIASFSFATLFAGGDLTANAKLALAAISSMAGGGDLLAPVLYDQFTLGTALAAGGDSILADAVLALTVNSSMTAGGSVLADLIATFLVDASLSGDAQMVSALTALLALDATLINGASLTAPNLVDNVEANLTAGATLTGEAIRIVYVEATLESQADFVAGNLLWTAHPFSPLPPPAFNSAYFLQQFIDATGVGRSRLRTGLSGDMAIVLNPRSTVVVLSSSDVNPFNRFGG